MDVESAGIGFALSVLNPERYHGQEIGSIQVLMNYDIFADNTSEGKITSNMTVDDNLIAKELLARIKETFDHQYSGWRAMNIFERQWVFRDFKKSMGLSAEQASEKLNISFEQAKSDFPNIIAEQYFFNKLYSYWRHQLHLLQGYEKDRNKLAENTQIINGWITDIKSLLTYIQ